MVTPINSNLFFSDKKLRDRECAFKQYRSRFDSIFGVTQYRHGAQKLSAEGSFEARPEDA